MSNKKVVIIGAGISGLSAGCYLQMNGYDTEIYELHTSPGGLCTSWKRKKYTIDGCIHWLVGSNPSDPYYRLWNELVDMKSLQFVDFDEYMTVEDEDGKSLTVYTNVDRLEREMLGKAPEDGKVILAFTKAIRKFLRMELPVGKAPETMGLAEGLKMMLKVAPYFGGLMKWTRITARDYAARCKNPLLAKTFTYLFHPDMVVLFLIFTLVWMHKKSGGYPIGGSLQFSKLIEKRYLELGGKIRYKSRVKQILTEGGEKADTAKGIRLENGKTVTADIIISAADGYATIFEMLGGKYVDDKIKSYYETLKPFPSYVQVSLGVSRTFEGVPHASVFPLPKPIRIDDTTRWRDIWLRIMDVDPTMAPKGKTMLIMMFTTENYQYWENLKQNEPKKYKSEKDRIAREVIDALDRRFGKIKSKVEMIDVSTPATVIRYTNNWKGSFEGWLMTPKTGFKPLKKVLPGLDRFYMIGQWVEPGGGLPTALTSGRNVAQVICKKDGKSFTTRPCDN